MNSLAFIQVIHQLMRKMLFNLNIDITWYSSAYHKSLFPSVSHVFQTVTLGWCNADLDKGHVASLITAVRCRGYDLNFISNLPCSFTCVQMGEFTAVSSLAPFNLSRCYALTRIERNRWETGKELVFL